MGSGYDDTHESSDQQVTRSTISMYSKSSSGTRSIFRFAVCLARRPFPFQFTPDDAAAIYIYRPEHNFPSQIKHADDPGSSPGAPSILAKLARRIEV